MTLLQLLLGLTSALCLLYCGVSASEETRFSKRFLRSANVPPAAVDCELTGWGEWSECDPCTNQRYRSRSIVKFGQYGGKVCLSPLGEIQRCKTDRHCEKRPVDCGNDFECDSGRCIKSRLLCNGDNDCGDSSDELCDDGQDPKRVCTTDIELSEIGRTAGDSFNFLGMETKRNAFDNEYYNGICDRVRDGNTRTYYRKPWNVAALVYQTKADKKFATDTFEDSVELLTKIAEEKTVDFAATFAVKVTPTESNDTKIGGSLGGKVSYKKSIEKVKQYSTKKNKQYLRVTGSVQLGTFQMRTRNIILSSTFIEDLNSLPLAYEKAEYLAFMEMYGTHYAVSGVIGGKYDLVYMLDSIVMKSKDIDSSTVKTCLGFEAEISAAVKKIDGSVSVKPDVCKTVLENTEGSTTQSAVIEDTVSFVEGGTVDFAAVFEEKLSQRTEQIDVQLFSKWASSLVDAPVIIKKKLSPIYTLIPIDLHEAYNKTKNLERALEEYLDEYNVCKCQPCLNGGTVVLLDGECVCKCPLEYKGIACETLKHDQLKKTDRPIVGHWGCWTPLSPCVNGIATRTRKCISPSQSHSTPCLGESTKTIEC
ncbi:complement component C9 [Mixophyes fleayi]|uniref:complement component C9 n=1 Tax=Mixophyes fleayi TaxID=3061075 RepID=UPI003F4DCCD6